MDSRPALQTPAPKREQRRDRQTTQKKANKMKGAEKQVLDRRKRNEVLLAYARIDTAQNSHASISWQFPFCQCCVKVGRVQP